jgi:hypothetical protein
MPVVRPAASTTICIELRSVKGDVANFFRSVHFETARACGGSLQVVLMEKRDRRDIVMRVRLTRKCAEAIDGVDLSRHCVGDFIDLPQHDAELLLAEGWALPADSDARVTAAGHGVRATAADARRSRKRQR